MRLASSHLSTFHVPGPAARDAALWILRDEDGRESAGEAAPLAGWSAPHETLEATLRVLHAVRDRIDPIDEREPAVAAVERALSPRRDLLRAFPAAAFALETALFDLLAQRRGDDLATCLRGAPRALDEVETSALILHPAEGPSFVERGLAALAAGFRVLKVKLCAEDDGALAREIDGLTALRRAAPDFELRLDPNGRWSIEDARRRIALLAPLRPAFVEQPVPAAALAELGPCAVPWAADESLASPGVVDRLSREGGCGAFVIKPAALGVARARWLASVARGRALPVTITHFLDGPVGLAAACEVALSLAGTGVDLLACGLDPHDAIRDLPRELLPHHRERGRIRCTGTPGIGLPVRALLGSAFMHQGACS
jgi:L-alanine-DL-glutamate epimerase-like enolase superfamily enzyme